MTYGRQTYGVLLDEESIARQSGALLVYLEPFNDRVGVTALSYKTGAILRRGDELWVRADLKAHNIPIIEAQPLSEGALMGVYMDFDRRADKAWKPAEYLLKFAAAVSEATVKRRPR